MNEMDSEMQAWVAGHAADDPAALRLKYHGKPGYDLAITQIECRRKAASRLPNALACPAFMFPAGLSAEQATSEALARVHADIAGYAAGSRHLDLTCGLGIDAFEAARRGARVTAVEINPVTAAAARHNAAALGLADRMEVIDGDSALFAAACRDEFDTVFIDPARRGEGGRRLTAIAECSPDVAAMMPALLRMAPKVVVKASPMLDVTSLAAELDDAAEGAGAVTRITATGTARECKELVAVVERGAEVGGFSVEAITATPGGDISIFRATGATPAPTASARPAPEEYLYEPYPAVMKTGAWGAVAALAPGLCQLHPNTHLFISAEKLAAFPGRCMVIERVEPFGSRTLKALARDCPMVNVAVRNFPLTAPELERRLRSKPGGDLHLYGVRATQAATPLLILARR